MSIRTPLMVAAALLAGLSFVSSLSAKDIVDTAAGADQFKTLVAAVKAAGLVDTLKGDGPFTVFAPTDEAFAALPAGTVEELLKEENRGQLTAILTYHVIPGNVSARDAFGVDSAATVNGQRIDISKNGGRLMIDEANVVKTDITTDNGTIHVIDRVLLPSSKTIPEIASEAGAFGTLLAAVKTAGLAEVLGSEGPFTVFAPTDEAFGKLPEGTVESLLKEENRDTLVAILKYHVISGRVYSDAAVKVDRANTLLERPVQVGYDAEGLMINESRVIDADIEASNGVIHVIDSVLLPPERSASDACAVLEAAVERGAPMYNHGNHKGCCNVYRTALEELADMSDVIPSEGTEFIGAALRKAEHEHHMGRRAWIYRHAMDRAYSMMSTRL